MNIEIKVEKRNFDEKNESAIQLYVDGEYEDTIRILKDKEITDQVLKAIKNGVEQGIRLTKNKFIERKVLLTKKKLQKMVDFL
jgi:hypothetical protein